MSKWISADNPPEEAGWYWSVIDISSLSCKPNDYHWDVCFYNPHYHRGAKFESQFPVVAWCKPLPYTEPPSEQS